MVIARVENGYVLSVGQNVQISFDSFENRGFRVVLSCAGVGAVSLYFNQATEFYKAWRAMEIGND